MALDKLNQATRDREAAQTERKGQEVNAKKDKLCALCIQNSRRCRKDRFPILDYFKWYQHKAAPCEVA